jgi:hypothetical protein
MNRIIAIFAILVFNGVMCFGLASACDIYLTCDNVLNIDVVKGTSHLSGGKSRIVYVVCVDVDKTKIDLE